MALEHEHRDEREDEPPRFWRSRYSFGFLVLGLVAAYFLVREHAAHVAGVLPYLLLLACPLMHLFMHRGHHHGHHHSRHHDHSHEPHRTRVRDADATKKSPTSDQGER